MIKVSGEEVDMRGSLIDLMAETTLILVEMSRASVESAEEMDVPEIYAVAGISRVLEGAIKFDKTGVFAKALEVAYERTAEREEERIHGKARVQKECNRKEVGDPMPERVRGRMGRYRRSGE